LPDAGESLPELTTSSSRPITAGIEFPPIGRLHVELDCVDHLESGADPVGLFRLGQLISLQLQVFEFRDSEFTPASRLSARRKLFRN